MLNLKRALANPYRAPTSLSGTAGRATVAVLLAELVRKAALLYPETSGVAHILHGLAFVFFCSLGNLIRNISDGKLARLLGIVG